MKSVLMILLVILSVSVSGCASSKISIEENPLYGNSSKHILEIKTESPVQNVMAEFSESPDSLNLASALRLAVKYNLSLKGFSAEIRAKDAVTVQSGLIQNPELEIKVGNFGLDENSDWFNGLETEVTISQLIELGGRINKRHKVAQLDKTLSEWDYQSRKLDVLADTAKAFIKVLVAQEQVDLNESLYELAENMDAAVSEKVESGNVPPVEQVKSKIELITARTALRKSESRLESAKKRLAGFWSSENTDFKAIGVLNSLVAAPAEELMKPFLDMNPDLIRWKTAVKKMEAALALSRSEAVPDMNLSMGYQNSYETKNNTFMLGISVPIPLFNFNQGGISEARANIEKTTAEHNSARVTLLTELSDASKSLSEAYVEASALHDEILPGAIESYEAVNTGYNEGKFDFMQLLDAKRTLFSVKRKYLISLGAYQTARIDIERMTGVSLEEIVTTYKEKKELKK